MAERPTTPGPDPDDAHDADPAPPADGRSLFDRWWSQAATVAVIGAVVVGFQWEVISNGTAIWGNWVMAALGLGAIGVGAYLFVKDREARRKAGHPTRF